MDDRPSDPGRRPSDGTASRRRRRDTVWILLGLLAVMAVGAAAWLGFRTLEGLRGLGDVRVSETVVRDLAWAVLQRESPERFLVTGRLQTTATTEVENTRRLLPGVLDLSLGTSRATVRVPGRIFYGVDLAGFRRDDVSLVGDSVVRVRLPPVTVKAVEAVLEEMVVRTERGWARLPGRSDREAERRAIELLGPLLREQGAAHLADSRQPKVNTARAVAGLLAPVLREAGLARPTLHVVLGEERWTVPSGAPGGGAGR